MYLIFTGWGLWSQNADLFTLDKPGSKRNQILRVVEAEECWLWIRHNSCISSAHHNWFGAGNRFFFAFKGSCGSEEGISVG